MRMFDRYMYCVVTITVTIGLVGLVPSVQAYPCEWACCYPDNPPGEMCYNCTVEYPCSCPGEYYHPEACCTSPKACCLPDDTCELIDPLCCVDLGGDSFPFLNTCNRIDCGELRHAQEQSLPVCPLDGEDIGVAVCPLPPE